MSAASHTGPTSGVLLQVRDLRTHFPIRTGVLKAVDGVSFDVERGKTLCVVGESGSGKSVTARSILQIVDEPGRIVSGSMVLHRPDGSTVDLAQLGKRSKEIRAVRGAEIAMIFQEPMSSLSPVHTVGNQIMEVLQLHLNMDKRQARARCVELLTQVEIPNPDKAVDRYTFEFSGGMRQRVMIAMSLACNPALLIADEPTTALDVTTQAEILDLIKKLQVSHGMAVMFITHDMGVVAEIADQVIVMHHGKVVETGPVEDIFHAPQGALHPDADRLGDQARAHRRHPPQAPADSRRCLADPGGARPAAALRQRQGADQGGRRGVAACDAGGIAGHRGRVGLWQDHDGPLPAARLRTRTAGSIAYRRADGSVVDMVTADKHTLKDCRREIRMIFQDPVGSLNPRMTVAQIVGEPLLVNNLAKGKELDDRVAELLQSVGLEPAWRERYPHAFSGGQRQRIGIARALALNPRLIVADEATSALDVSLRSQMLDLLLNLQDKLGLSFIFISHDIAVIRYFCDRVAVMYRGKVVETGETNQVCDAPTHAYTQALLSAIPQPDPRARSMHKRFRYNPQA